MNLVVAKIIIQALQIRHLVVKAAVWSRGPEFGGIMRELKIVELKGYSDLHVLVNCILVASAFWNPLRYLILVHRKSAGSLSKTFLSKGEINIIFSKKVIEHIVVDAHILFDWGVDWHLYRNVVHLFEFTDKKEV